jgi:hypothetical protein
METQRARASARRITGNTGEIDTEARGRRYRAQHGIEEHANGAAPEEAPAETKPARKQRTPRHEPAASEVEAAPGHVKTIKKGTRGTFAVTVVLDKRFERLLTMAGWSAEERGRYDRAPMQGVAHTYVRHLVHKHCEELAAKAR